MARGRRGSTDRPLTRMESRAARPTRELKAANEHAASTDERLDRLEELKDLPRAGFAYKYSSWGVMGMGGIAIGILLAGRKKKS